MLARQYGRDGRRLLTSSRRPPIPRSCPSYKRSSPALENQSIWITDGELCRAFLSFTRHLSGTLGACQRQSADPRSRWPRDMTRAEPPRPQEISASGWGDIPPTFSWSLGSSRSGMPTLGGSSSSSPSARYSQWLTGFRSFRVGL